jgi:hypothetical protein
VGEVDHVHDAEDQRQARGDERQDHAVHEAVDRLHEICSIARSHSQVLVNDARVRAEGGGRRLVAYHALSP